MASFCFVLKSDNITIYIDGSEELIVEVTSNVVSGFGGLKYLRIGGLAIHSSRCLCDMAEIEVFSRALNQQEIKRSFNRCSN